MNQLAHQEPLPFNTRMRWAMRVLAWVGFCIAAYLAWTSAGKLPIAGCSGVGLFDCDAVHNSVWSQWFGVPVALPGLACYATLAGLSVLLGWHHPSVSRWVNTAFVGLTIMAGGAAVWFVVLQVAVLGKICPACIALHVCGVGLATLAIWCLAKQQHPMRSNKPTNHSVAALRFATAAPGSQPVSGAAPARDSTPSLGLAIGGAGALLIILIGGQVVFPAKEYVEQTVELDIPFEMGDATNDEAIALGAAPENGGEPHVAMRLSTDRDGPIDERGSSNEEANPDLLDGIGDRSDSPSNDDLFGESDQTSDVRNETSTEESLAKTEDEADATSPPGRIVEFLGGKLTLDISEHPVLGSRDAPYVVVEMISYDCPHCRKMHRVVEQARERYGDELAIVVLPVPLEKSCNKYITSREASHYGSCTLARFAMAVGVVDPEAFESYHNWLMADEAEAPSISEVMSKANSVVSRRRLRGVAYSDELKAKINHNVELFATLQKQHSANRSIGLPVQIVGDGVLSGVAEAEDVYRTWENRLGISPR